jgi:tRNA(fMet)-specific endonuclease VapC
MLDSTVLIDAERGRLDLPARLSALGDEPVAISAITASELLHGVHRARTEQRRAARQAFVEAVLGEVPIAEFGLEEARTHAAVWADLAREGRAVPSRDLLIAATALTLGFRLATSDLRHLARIPELGVEDWSPAAGV